MSVEQSGEQPRDAGGRFAEAEQHRAVEISDAIARADRPFDAFKPMERTPPAEKSDGTYGSDQPGIKEAARDLVKQRQQADLDAPAVERAYHTGSRLDQPRRPITETVKLREAAHDLQGARQAESDANDVLRNRSLAQKLDYFRQQADANDAADRGQPVEAQPVPQPQPEAAPTPQPTNGIDPEVAKALENPKIREALSQEAQMNAAVRQQYGQAINNAHTIATAAALEAFPELQTQNWQAALENLRTTNPARYSEAVGKLQRIAAINGQIQQQAAHQQQQAMAQWQSSAERHDQEYQDYASTRPAAEVKAVRDNVLEVMKSYGIDEREFGRMYNMGHPWARSGVVQRIFHDLTVLALARRAVGHKVPDHVSPVLRPGEAVTSGTDNSALAAAMRAFNADPNNPRLAAKALVARRKAAAGLR